MNNIKINTDQCFTIICIVAFGLIYLQCYTIATILMISFSLIFTFISAYKSKGKIKIILNFCRKFRIIFYMLYTSVFFILSALAKKYYNIKFGIEIDYLNYSVNVLAALLSIIIPAIIVIFLVNIFFFVKFFFEIIFKKNKINSLVHSMSSLLIMIVLLHILSISTKLDIYFLWLDSYYNSDCNPKQIPQKLFIRLNNSSCYYFSNEKNSFELKVINVKKN
jgi:hypothetical protein